MADGSLPPGRPPKRSKTERLPRQRVHLRLVPPRADGVPVTRADCASWPRPCLAVACRFNLWLDVTKAGSIVFNFPDVDPSDMVHSCALDEGERPRTLEEVGAMLNTSRERVRQMEDKALLKLARSSAVKLLAGGGT